MDNKGFYKRRRVIVLTILFLILLFSSFAEAKVNWGNIEVTGIQKIPVICVQFSDTVADTTTYNTEYFRNQIFRENYAKSMYNYWKECSYGKFFLDDGDGDTSTDYPGNPICWVTVDNPQSYYGYGNGNKVCELMRDAVVKAEQAGFDFTPFDNDNDGDVDDVLIIHC